MKKGIIIVLISLISILIGLNNVNASTITSYDATFSTSNRYYYSTSNTLQNNSLGVIGNVYSGKSYNFTFYLETSSLTAQSTYDITINANSNDFTKNLNASSIYIKTSNSTDFTNSTNGISLISFTNTATSSKNSNKIVLRIYINSLTSYTMIDIFNSNYANITSVSNFGIKSLSIEQVDTSGNNEIIENDKNNTQNIINNSNQNTDEIKNTIKDNLNSCRDSVNLFNKNDFVELNAYFNDSTPNITSNNTNYTLYIAIKPNTTYTVSINGKSGTYTLGYTNVSPTIGTQVFGITDSKTITTGSNAKYLVLRYYHNSNATISKSEVLDTLQIQEGTTATPYEEYGIEICNNKLDDINKTLTGEYNYNKEPSEEINGKEEINDYTEKEEQLFSSLDFEGIGDNEIIINPNASTFIWEIIDRLRGMNAKIVLLMTSILGLGIIKMVLNR